MVQVTALKKPCPKTALRDYGHLGPLIKTWEYYKTPEPDIANYDLVNDPYGIIKMTFMEHLKESWNKSLKMYADWPKFYVLMLQYIWVVNV